MSNKKQETKNIFSGIYFTTNDFYRTIGLAFIIAGQFTHKLEYTIYDQTFQTSELTLIGVGIAIIFPLLMRKFSRDSSQ
jgi:hypothetical protein